MNRSLTTFGIATILGGLIMTTSQAAQNSFKSIYEIPVTRLGEKTPKTLENYKGKVLLIVNTASQCGYTPQYAGLENLQKKYSASGAFTVLGFPSNDFGRQEPGTAEEIKNFCDKNYKISFPLFEKNPVTPPNTQPLYAFLTQGQGAVGWNFEKFLVNKKGEIVKRFKSGVKPEDKELIEAIELALK